MKKLSIHESCSIFNIQTIIIMEKLSDVEIRKIYHKLCLKYHPDKNTDSDPNKFIELQEAYNTIIEYRKNRIFKEMD